MIDNHGYEILAKSTLVKAEVINDAIHGEPKEILPAARDYLIDLHVIIAKMKGMPKWSPKVAALTEVTKSGVEYNKALGEAFDQMLDSEDESDERYRALKANLLTQARLLNHKIEELERHTNANRIRLL